MQLVGALLIGAGVFLMVRKRHSHFHTDEILEHDHLHSHAEHHMHAHDGPVIGPIRIRTSMIR